MGGRAARKGRAPTLVVEAHPRPLPQAGGEKAAGRLKLRLSARPISATVDPMAVEQFLSHYGLAAVALGAAFEGETAVIAGGLLAHRGLWPLGGAVMAAFLGSFAADQAFFAIGRTCRETDWVRRLQRRSVFAKALDVFHRHPTGFILAFRFLYGLRIVSPVAIGTSLIPARRFLLLNLIAAAIWAPLFTILGYTFGKGLERWFGGRHLPLWAIGAGVLTLVAGGFALHLLIRRWRR